MNVQQLWRAWGIGLAVIAVLIVLWGGAGSPARNPRDAGDLITEVPAVPAAVVAAADAAELETSLLWGAAGATVQSAAEQEAASTPQWTLGGVFMKDDRRQVVVHFVAGDKPPGLLAEGDTLPDGARIVAIARDKVHVEMPGKADGTRWLTVNRGGPSGPAAD